MYMCQVFLIFGVIIIFFVFLFFAVKPVVAKVKQLRLARDDFEFLKVIGRGAFGEVGGKKDDDDYALL